MLILFKDVIILETIWTLMNMRIFSIILIGFILDVELCKTNCSINITFAFYTN